MRARDRNVPSDTPCPGIGEARKPARDRIVAQARMGGAAFILLKIRHSGLESGKQAEIHLTNLDKILRTCSAAKSLWAEGRKGRAAMGICADFYGIWLICRKSLALLFRSQF